MTTPLTPVVYPLTPLQQGMLYHSLAEPNSGVNVEQVILNLPEFIDADLLRGAWERLLARHAVLRTRFRWEGLDAPVQVVPPAVNLAWSECDWTILSPEEQTALFDKFLHVDRLRGFPLEQAPVLRVALLRLGAENCRLVWTFHHAILDGRCYPALLQEVFADYAAARRGETFTPEPRTEFREFVTWLNARDSAVSDEFWHEQLNGIVAATPLPIDREVPPASETEAEPRLGVATARVNAETVTALRAFATEHDLTLGTLIQGAWALMLSRHSGSTEIVFGATRACRKDGVAGVESVLGLVINTVPLRVSFCHNESLLACLQSLRARWLAIRPHEQTPLPRIQRLSDVPAGQALFDSLVVVENYRIGDRLRERDPTWAARTVELREQTNYALTLAAGINCEMGLRLFYDRRRYREEMADVLLAELQEFFALMLRDPRRTISTIIAQRPASTPESTPGRRFFAPQETLVSRFEAQAQQTPDNIAVTGVNTQLTYRELDARAEALAQRLRARGVAPEVRVGLFVDRSPELIVAILGILKAGGAYVPIDPTYPPERISFLLADAGAGVLVTHNGLESRLPPNNARLVRVDDLSPVESSGAVPRTPAKPDSLAYVIYTSGSTGKPKGVEITHHNVVRLFEGAREWFDFGADDVWTMFHSPAFDFSVWEIWGALLYGGRLVIVPYGVSRSPADFLELLARERVTVLNQTPSAFRQLQFAESENPPTGGLALRYVVFGGEALDVRGLRLWFERHGDERPKLVNMYGITETTVHVTVRPLTKADTEGGSVIGVPLPDLQLYVLDAERRPVAAGETGELYVGGAGLARGYLNRPELTAERFIPSPFAKGERLYRTGDLARPIANGDLEYLGRGDQQVKIRGFRIELGEIESVLADCAGVRGAVVQPRADASGDKRLVAYLVADPQDRPTTAQLREHCSGRLPEYMVPAAFVLLERLPLTAHGKIDRAALPEPPAERPDLASPYIAPRTEAERIIAAAWCAVLNLERVGLDDNFYELGGDSLSLVTLCGRLRVAGYSGVTITDFFQFPTVGALARHLGKPASVSSANPWTDPAAPAAAAVASAQS